MTHNTCHISWDSYDVFCPPNVGFCDLASQKPEIQHWEGQHTFCWNMGVVRGVPIQCYEDYSSVQLNCIQPFVPTGDDRLTQTVINFGSCEIQHLPQLTTVSLVEVGVRDVQGLPPMAQPAPRQSYAPMAGKPMPSSHEPPHQWNQAPVTLSCQRE